MHVTHTSGEILLSSCNASTLDMNAFAQEISQLRYGYMLLSPCSTYNLSIRVHNLSPSTMAQYVVSVPTQVLHGEDKAKVIHYIQTIVHYASNIKVIRAAISYNVALDRLTDAVECLTDYDEATVPVYFTRAIHAVHKVALECQGIYSLMMVLR